MSETRNTEWIESVEARLRWFMEEATDEEFDEEEVDTLVSLLNRLKPMNAASQQSDEETLASFHEYVKRREAEERENKVSSTGMPAVEKEAKAEETTGNGTDNNGRKSKDYKENRNKGIEHKGFKYIIKNHKLVATAAAILLIIIVAGGSMGVANANKGNGFFYWLQKDDEGMTMLTSPEGMDGKMVFDESEKYYFKEQIPEQYHKYIIEKEKIDQLKDFNLKVVTINKANTYLRIKQWFTDESEEKNVCIGALVYEENIRLARDSHIKEEIQTIEEDGKIEDGVLVRENKIGSENTKIYFYMSNIKYVVEGDIDAETLIQIAEVYRDSILKQ